MEIKNVKSFNDFKSLKSGSSLVTEMVINQGESYQVNKIISVPKSLIKSFMKKIKDESGKNVVEEYSEAMVAELVVDYLTTTFMTIENIPTTVILGTSSSVQPVVQSQPQVQTTQNETNPTENTDNVDNVQANATANEVPATEGGNTSGVQTQNTTTAQGKTGAQSPQSI